jgi:hypothetical protein
MSLPTGRCNDIWSQATILFVTLKFGNMIRGPSLWLTSPSTRRRMWYLFLNTTACSRAWPVFAQHWFTQTECLSAGHREFTSPVKLTKSGTCSLQMPGPRPSHWARFMSYLGKRHTKKVPESDTGAGAYDLMTCIRREYILACSVEMLAFVVNQGWFRSPNSLQASHSRMSPWWSS